MADVIGPDPDPVIAAAPCGRIRTGVDERWGLGTATFSRGPLHRFRLSRVWDPHLPRINFVMLNPSTADALVLDPTVRRCAGFAEGWGFGALEVTNVFALRSTDPHALRTAANPVGPGNDDAIREAARAAQLVVAAWGVHGKLNGREAEVRELLASVGTEVVCLRRTRAGHPGHPLYVRRDAEPLPWP